MPLATSSDALVTSRKQLTSESNLQPHHRIPLSLPAIFGVQTCIGAAGALDVGILGINTPDLACDHPT